MQTLDIRQKLHQYIDDGDEKLLKMMFAVAKEYNEDDDAEYIFTAEEIRVFDERRKKRLTRESKVYTRNDARDIITGKGSDKSVVAKSD